MWKEFEGLVPGDLPDDQQLEEEWMQLMVKIDRKADIEGGRSKLKELKKRQEEETALYTDEKASKW